MFWCLGFLAINLICLLIVIVAVCNAPEEPTCCHGIYLSDPCRACIGSEPYGHK